MAVELVRPSLFIDKAGGSREGVLLTNISPFDHRAGWVYSFNMEEAFAITHRGDGMFVDVDSDMGSYGLGYDRDGKMEAIAMRMFQCLDATRVTYAKDLPPEVTRYIHNNTKPSEEIFAVVQPIAQTLYLQEGDKPGSTLPLTDERGPVVMLNTLFHDLKLSVAIETDLVTVEMSFNGSGTAAIEFARCIEPPNVFYADPAPATALRFLNQIII